MVEERLTAGRFCFWDDLVVVFDAVCGRGVWIGVVFDVVEDVVVIVELHLLLLWLANAAWWVWYRSILFVCCRAEETTMTMCF